MIALRAATRRGAIILLALLACACCSAVERLGDPAYPLVPADVTVLEHHRAVVLGADGRQTTTVKQKVRLNTRAAKSWRPPEITWSPRLTSALLLDATVIRRDERTFHLGPNSPDDEVPLYPYEAGTDLACARVPLPELRAGDVVSWSVELSGTPLMDGQLFAHMIWRGRFPVTDASLCVTVPAGTTVDHRSYGAVPEPAIEEQEATVTYEWRLEDAAPSAGSAVVLPQTVVSTVGSWTAVASWLRERVVPEQIEAIPGLEVPDGADSEDFLERVRAVVAAVDGAVAIAYHGPLGDPFRPRPPAEVVRSGIGDCNDRALVLHNLLAQAGLVTHLAVMPLGRGLPLLDEQPPTPLFLDHVIVGVSGPGHPLWLDPTGAARHELDLGRTLKALVLHEQPKIVTVTGFL